MNYTNDLPELQMKQQKNGKVFDSVFIYISH